MSVVCCQVQVRATGRSLVQRSPIEYGVSECDRGTSAMWIDNVCRAIKKMEHCWNDNDRGNSNLWEINLSQGHSGHLETCVDWDATETGSSR